MNKIAAIFIRVALIVSVLALAACQPRPNRPDPNQTTHGLGPGHATGGGGITFSAVNDDTLFHDMDTTLQPRAAGDIYDPANQIRGELDSIYFDFDRSTINPSERPKAQAAANYLHDNPGRRLLIEGHCDWRGTTEYNLGLGDRRASSVKDYIVSLGIDRNRIEVLSKGDLEAAVGGSEDQMRRDRRAELVVLRR